jgi:hypothetical protein
MIIYTIRYGLISSYDTMVAGRQRWRRLADERLVCGRTFCYVHGWSVPKPPILQLKRIFAKGASDVFRTAAVPHATGTTGEVGEVHGRRDYPLPGREVSDGFSGKKRCI